MAEAPNLHRQGLVSHQFLQATILLLQVLRGLGHLCIHPAALLTPAVIRLLRDAQLVADLGYVAAFPQLNARLAELRHNLLRAMSLLYD